MVSTDFDRFQILGGGIMADSLENLTREELMNLARDRGIKGCRLMNKDDLSYHFRRTSTRSLESYEASGMKTKELKLRSQPIEDLTDVDLCLVSRLDL